MARCIRFLLLCLVASGVTASAEDPPAVPTPEAFTRLVRQVMRGYPTDGTHRYWWPRGKKSGGWAGNTRDLRYGGQLFSRGDPHGRAYCCGLTFEVFFRAWQRWAEQQQVPFRIGGLDRDGLLALRKRWFCGGTGRRGPLDALLPLRLGVQIRDPREARPGDFVQLWRRNKSGHSVIFLGWVRRGGKRVGIRYWSTQRSTNGIGVQTESFSGKMGVLPSRIHVVRVGRKQGEGSKQ